MLCLGQHISWMEDKMAGFPLPVQVEQEEYEIDTKNAVVPVHNLTTKIPKVSSVTTRSTMMSQLRVYWSIHFLFLSIFPLVPFFFLLFFFLLSFSCFPRFHSVASPIRCRFLWTAPSAGSFSPAAVPAASAFPQTITLSGQGLLTADSMIGIIASSATACSSLCRPLTPSLLLSFIPRLSFQDIHM